MDRLKLKKYVEFMLNAKEQGLEINLYCYPKYNPNNGSFIGFKTFLAEKECEWILAENERAVLVLSQDKITYKDREIRNMQNENCSCGASDNWTIECTCEPLNKEEAEEIWYDRLITDLEKRNLFIREFYNINENS